MERENGAASRPSVPRRIIGNLDCEESWGERTKRLSLPEKVLGSISALATLLRTFAGGGDRLWTPRPVSQARLARVEGLAIPPLESGQLDRLPAASCTLAWGQTREVERATARAGRPSGELPVAPAAGLIDRLWAIAPPGQAVAGRFNDRLFCLELARALGCALPGAQRIDSIDGLKAHFAGEGTDASKGKWVLKACLSAAGRFRVWGEGAKLGDDVSRNVAKLLARSGPLIFEPWMDRTEDFGCLAILDRDGLHPLGIHRLDVDAKGGFRGIELPPGAGGGVWLLSEEEADLDLALRGAAERLDAAGYRGPFGIDCWRYRDREGRQRFHPLGEINARMSFGLVARGIRERLERAGRIRGGAPLRLRVGRSEDENLKALSGDQAVPILLPATDEPTAAWVEVMEQ